MEQNSLSEIEEELNQIDVDSIKLDAIIKLKTWQKKMHLLVDNTYKVRLNEIDSVTSNLLNEITEKQNQIEHLQADDEHGRQQLKHDIDLLKSYVIVNESIPEKFVQYLERTIRISTNNDDQDQEIIDSDFDDDEPVIVDIDRHETHGNRNQVVMVIASPSQSASASDEGRVSKIINSYPIQHVLALGLAKTLAHVGTVAATTTTTAAATTMAKTAIIATACGIGTAAYGVGKIAIGTTRKALSLIFSYDE